jgi:hypothetical protein
LKNSTKYFSILAWLQLMISIVLAAAMIWGYLSYQASLGLFVHSVAASIGAVSNTVVRTAETVEANKELIDQTGHMLAVTRNLINEFRIAAESQVKNGPQYAAGLDTASKVTGKLANTFDSLGQKLFLLSVPTGIEMQGLKPLVVMSRLWHQEGTDLKGYATDLKVSSATLAVLSSTIGRDGGNLGAAVIAESEQAIKVIISVEKTLAQIKAQDLPKAIADLKTTSENLRAISSQIDMVGNGGLILLIIGLLLATWCMVHSLGVLMLAKSNASELISLEPKK